MANTFIQTQEGVSVQGFFIPKDVWLNLEPGYLWNDEIKKRIYRLDRTIPNPLVPEEPTYIGAHVVVIGGKQNSQPFPWPEGEEYCGSVEHYKKIIELAQQKSVQRAYRKEIEDYKQIVRDQCVEAKTSQEKQQIEDTLQEIDDSWNNKLKVILLGRKLEKFYGWKSP